MLHAPLSPAQLGDALGTLLNAALPLLEQVERNTPQLAELEPVLLSSFPSSEWLRARLARQELVVAVIGEKKAGKSTFLNAMMGERVLGVAAREFTGVPCHIRAAIEPELIAWHRDGRVERFSRSLPDEASAHARHERTLVERLERLAAQVEMARAEEAPLAQAWEEARAQLETLELTREQILAAESQLQQELSNAEHQPLTPERWALLDGPEPWRQWLIAALAKLAPAWVAHQQALRDATQRLEEARAARREELARLRHEHSRVAALREPLSTATRARWEAWKAQNEQLESSIKEQESARMALALHRTRQARFREERRRAFLSAVRQMTDMRARAADLTKLELDWPAPLWPQGVVLLDTPGLNTDHLENQTRTWGTIEEEADVCFLLSDLQQAVSQSTLAILERTLAAIPACLVILTKRDRALENARTDDGPVGWASAEAQVIQAVQTARRRLSKLAGVPPEQVPMVDLAAEPALQKGTSGLEEEQFWEHARGIWGLLEEERGLLLRLRPARAIAGALERLHLSVGQGAQRCRTRMARLESGGLPSVQQVLEKERALSQARLGELLAALGQECAQELQSDLLFFKEKELEQLQKLDSAKLAVWADGLPERLRREAERGWTLALARLQVDARRAFLRLAAETEARIQQAFPQFRNAHSAAPKPPPLDQALLPHTQLLALPALAVEAPGTLTSLLSTTESLRARYVPAVESHLQLARGRLTALLAESLKAVQQELAPALFLTTRKNVEQVAPYLQTIQEAHHRALAQQQEQITALEQLHAQVTHLRGALLPLLQEAEQRSRLSWPGAGEHRAAGQRVAATA